MVANKRRLRSASSRHNDKLILTDRTTLHFSDVSTAYRKREFCSWNTEKLFKWQELLLETVKWNVNVLQYEAENKPR